MTGWENVPAPGDAKDVYMPHGTTHADPTMFRTGVEAKAGHQNIATPGSDGKLKGAL